MNQLVSVIVPVYNHEKFIGVTIESVLFQTYKNWELLIVDDCSTDGSWGIIQEYAKKDSRIRAFRNDENKGLIPNWKFLIDTSRGEYIAFLEGDDFFYENNLKRKLEVFEKYSDLGMVYCNFDVVNEKGEMVTRDYRSFQNVRVYKNECISPSEYLSSKHHLINSYGQVMIRKYILKKVGYPRTLDPSEKVFLPSDWDFNFRVSTQNKVYYLEEVLFAYRRHSNNNSYDAVKAYKHISLLLAEYEKNFRENKGVITAIRYKRGRYTYSKALYYLENGEKGDARRECFNYFKNLQFASLMDFDLNVKLIIRMFLPNFINVYIRRTYYHQN
ncbi:MAG: hypothetical protein QG606_118 [Patescibacteria group bacterium]|jgi:teichuronic acid biosynthesis glycosyltransferase TuaG|nr:hypothetical protein [Patescibacteria group bacterium]